MYQHHSHVPFHRTEFPAAETELRNEDPVAYEPGWSHDPASSVMVDDNSILAFQASNKSSNSDVSAQPSADTCDAAGAAPSTRPSVLTQTDRPGTAEALVNTEVAMSDLDYLAEVRGEDDREAVLAGKTVKTYSHPLIGIYETSDG